MIINSTSTGNFAAPKSDAEKAGLNYDAFLKLMLEQLKSQDPLNPVDQTESLAQLASFSSVEQSIKTNQKLDALLKQSAVSDAAVLIGKSVQSLSGGASGVVSAVEIRSGGTEAILSNGSRIALADGIRITNP